MNAVDVAIGVHLSVAATTLYGLVGTRVYLVRAKTGAVLPYVTYNVQAGGYVNDNPTDRAEWVYNIQGYAASAIAAAAIDDAITARLHNIAVSIAGWSLMSAMREGDIQYDEDVNGSPVYHRGALYRVQVTK